MLRVFAMFLSLTVLGCQNLKVSGNYRYIKQDNNDQRNNSLTLSHVTKIKKDVPLIITQRINSDVLLPNKPAYYEGSYELWFW